MKPPLFHVGQAVVWALDKPCPRHPAYTSGPLPRKGPVYTVESLEPRHHSISARNGNWFCRLVEFPHAPSFPEKALAAVELLPDEALAELLAETLEPVTA